MYRSARCTVLINLRIDVVLLDRKIARRYEFGVRFNLQLATRKFIERNVEWAASAELLERV